MPERPSRPILPHPSRRTLKLTRPYPGQVFAQAIVILLLITLLIEQGLRGLDSGQSDLALTVNNALLYTRYTPAVTKFAEFGDLTAETPVDCIVIGSSLVEYLHASTVADHINAQSGEALRCYNFALIDGSASTIATALRLLTARYDGLRLVIWGIQAHSFYRIADTQEDRFSESDWVRYAAGTFSVGGWLHDRLVTVRFLRTYPSLLLFDDSEPSDSDDDLPRRANRVAIALDDGSLMALSYADSAPIFAPTREQYIHYLTDAESSAADWAAVRAVAQLARSHTLDVVLVEMPTRDPDGPSRAVMDDVQAQAARENLPFLPSQALDFPATAFIDTVESTPRAFIHNHLHISGSLPFSAWVGAQIGRAVAAGALRDPTHPVWRDLPAQLPDLGYAERLGLSVESYRAFQQHTPRDPGISTALIVNPSPVALDRAWLQTNLGYVIDWDTDLRAADRASVFDLLVVLERMAYPTDLEAAAQTALAVWWQSLDPALLRDQGIEYVVCRIEQVESATAHCPPGLDAAGYERVAQWAYSPLYEQYLLYRVPGP